MAVLCNNVIAGASIAEDASDSGYQIEKSIRFNFADGSKLERSLSSGGNTKTWTASWWMKRMEFTTDQRIFTKHGGGGGEFFFKMGESNNATYPYRFFIRNNISGTEYDAYTDIFFRDPTAWQHIVFIYDSTHGTATERYRIFVNGVKRTFTYTHNDKCVQNGDAGWNSASSAMRIAGSFGGYLADVQFIDGLALYPLSFAEWDSSGAWVPREFRKWSPNDGTDFSGDGTATGTWSNASGSGGHAQMFDGDTSTLAYNSGGADTYATFTFDKPIPFSTIRLYAGEHGTDDTQILINGKDLKYHFVWNVAGSWADITSQVPGNKLEKISLKDKGGACSNIRAIEIDGEILEDSATYYR